MKVKKLSKKIKHQSKEKKKNKKKNREFAVVAYSFLSIFIIMIGYFVYFNAFKSETVINNPYNSRQDTFAKNVIRGDILDVNGNVLATTKVAADGTETRYYPYGSIFAHAVGYSTKGKTGIESYSNFNLLRSNIFFIDKIVNEIQNEKSRGDSVVTTLDANLQQTAYNALGNKKGAVIVMEPSTGRILVNVSKPSFDPNKLESTWETLISDDSTDSYLLNRATQGLYPPGSVFKIFTTLEFVRENPSYNSYSYNCSGSITENDYTLRCYDGKSHGDVDLKASFAKSCNSSYANIGLSLNNDNFKSLCDSMMFNSKFPYDFEYNKSSFTLNSASSINETMMTAIGQGETLVTPLHMVMVASAIANNGVLMKPYMVDGIQNADGKSVSKNRAVEYGRLISEDEANLLKDYMTEVVTNGTGYKFNGVNYSVAGKTGSAEYSSDKSKSHSWFVGFSPSQESQVAICVIVEGGGAGSETAVPVARAVLDAYYN